MKKNLMIAMLFVSILMVSVVSAGITGYLVSRGGGIADGGYTANLQKVTDGVATIAVTTPTGDTELIRVAEDEIAQVGNAKISASGLTEGTLFRRSGANVEIEVPEEKCEKFTLKEGELFGEEYKWEPIFNSDSGEVTGILIHFGGDIGDVKIIFGETTFVGETSITLYEIGNFEVGENWVILSVCPSEEDDGEDGTGTGGQCVTQNCNWRFSGEQKITMSNGKILPDAIAVECKPNEIVFEGSCHPEEPDFVRVAQGFTATGNEWACNFENSDKPWTGPDGVFYGRVGALCCSV